MLQVWVTIWYFILHFSRNGNITMNNDVLEESGWKIDFIYLNRSCASQISDKDESTDFIRWLIRFTFKSHNHRNE